MRITSPYSIFFSAVATLCLSIGSASAVTVNQDIVVIPSPPSVVEGALEGNDSIYLFKESSGVLGAPLAVDITAPGVYSGAGSYANSLISGPYDSWMLHFDPVGRDGGLALAVGEVTFDFDIIGIIIDSAELNSSDAIVGAPGTTYPTGYAPRGLDGGDTIQWEISLLGPRTLDVSLLTSRHGIDQIRVLTRAPEPSTYLLMGTLLMLVAYQKRRREAMSAA